MNDIYSLEAKMRHELAGSDARADAYAMKHGPIIRDGDIVIPSAWYKEEAVDIYKRLGMRYDPYEREWRRSMSEPFKGKVYSPAAWMMAARKAYRMVWPKWHPPSEQESDAMEAL